MPVLPKDTSHLTAISVADAQALAKRSGLLDLRGLSTITPDIARSLANRGSGKSIPTLNLNGLQALCVESAKALAGHPGELGLNGLTSLSADVAAALATHTPTENDGLSLNGLSGLLPDTAAALASYRGDSLYMTGIRHLDSATASAFAFGGMHLDLSGLSEITPELLKHCSCYSLCLNGVATLTDESVAHLSRWRGGYLHLNGVLELSDAVVTALMKLKRWKDGFIVFNDDLASTLKRLKSPRSSKAKRPSPDSVTTLTALDVVAYAKACKHGVLSFAALTAISEECAKALAERKGDVSLNGVKSISATAAGLLAAAVELLSLNGLEELQDETACALVPHKGDLLLNGLRALPENIAVLLAQHQGEGLHLDGLDSLSDETVMALAQYKGAELSLNGLKNLSIGAAQALAEYGGELGLDSLTVISDEVAGKLSDHRGRLTLGGLTTVSEGVATALAMHAGDLILSSVESLSEITARALAGHVGLLCLAGLKTLSTGAAQALASHKGTMILTSLEGLSNEAALALALAANEGALMISAATRQCLSQATVGRNAPSHPSLVAARIAGATTLRSTWHGFGDDGCFSHTFLRRGRPIKSAIDPEADIASIIAENEFIVEGDMNGSVSILEIDLATGDATFWDAQQANEHERLAELLLKCQWAGVDSFTASLKISGELEEGDDDYGSFEVSLGKVATTPASSGKAVKSHLRTTLDIISSLEGGDDLLADIGRTCGRVVSMAADIKSREVVFTGSEKKLSISVSEEGLSVTRFQVIV